MQLHEVYKISELKVSGDTCPLATQDVELNTKNRDFTQDKYNYGPLNVDEPGDYWEGVAEEWDTTVEAAMASRCETCVAFDISPRMDECMPGPVSDKDGRLGYCWMHHFKCHSARTCHTWAKGGPIDEDEVSIEWGEKNQMAYSESRSNNLRKKSGVDEALVGHEINLRDAMLKELGKMMAEDPKLTRKVADLAGMVLKKRIDKDGKWNGNYILKKKDLVNSVPTIKETIEFAQDFKALMKGMKEDLANRDKEIEENLRAWFGKGKKGGAGGGGWDRYNTKGERIGKCGDSKKGEGKPKCLSKSRAASLRAKGGKAAIGAAVRKKRREDPNKNRRGKAKNVSNTTKKKKK